jgi:hypothetical protein
MIEQLIKEEVTFISESASEILHYLPVTIIYLQVEKLFIVAI